MPDAGVALLSRLASAGVRRGGHWKRPSGGSLCNWGLTWSLRPESRWDCSEESRQPVGLRLTLTPVERSDEAIEREMIVRLSNLRWYYEMSIVPGPQCMQ